MDKNTTLQNLISFAYNETEILETVQIVDAIENDLDISEEYYLILATKNLLDANSVEPPQGILNKIFLYSENKKRVHSLS